jgi:homoserine kinase type II
MAVLTPITLDTLRSLGASWGLEVVAAQGVEAGSVNTSYALELRDGTRAFLRLYETRDLDAARGEMRLLAHLASHGVATPAPLLRTDVPGEALSVVAGRPVAVFPWVRGEVVCQRMVNPSRAAAVGAALGHLHRASEHFAEVLPDRFEMERIAARAASIDTASLPRALAETVEKLRARIEVQRARPLAARCAVIHGDLFRDNVLWEGDAITALLDFESASRGSRAFDLMVTALAWCFGDTLDLGAVRAMVSAYTHVAPLDALEGAALYDAACAAALRFSVTRITDFELRPRGTGVYKDYRRFVARLAAIEAIGASRWNDALGVEAIS